MQAIAAWGASGIGCSVNYYGVSDSDLSIVNNKELNSSRPATVQIDNTASVIAYSDGIRFAIDTNTANDATTDRHCRGSRDFAEAITNSLLQGTFMYEAELEGLNLDIWQLEGKTDQYGEVVANLQLPEGYRSFACNLPGASSYRVQIKNKAHQDKFAVYNVNENEQHETLNDEALKTLLNTS